MPPPALDKTPPPLRPRVAARGPWRVHRRQEGLCSLARFLLGRKPRLRRPADAGFGLAANSSTRLIGCALLAVNAPPTGRPHASFCDRGAFGAFCFSWAPAPAPRPSLNCPAPRAAGHRVTLGAARRRAGEWDVVKPDHAPVVGNVQTELPRRLADSRERTTYGDPRCQSLAWLEQAKGTTRGQPRRPQRDSNPRLNGLDLRCYPGGTRPATLKLVPSAGLEPAANCLEGNCSVR